MKIRIALLALLIPVVLVATTGKPLKETPSPAPDVAAMLKEHDQAVQIIGNLLIKNGLISPWLEAMKSTQQSLNALAEKNGVRRYALNGVVESMTTCKQFFSKEETPSIQQLHKLAKDKDTLVQQIIGNKSSDIKALISLDAKIDKAQNKLFRSVVSEKTPKKPKLSDDYKNLVKKLDAYGEIITAAVLPNFNLDDAVAKVLASDEASTAVATLIKYNTFSKDCDSPTFGIFRREADDSYGDMINTLVAFYDLGQKFKSFAQKMKKLESPKS
jgi:hypothetical protein